MARKKLKKKPVRRHPAKAVRAIAPSVPELETYTVLFDDNRTFQMRIALPTEDELAADVDEQEFPLRFEFVIHNDSVINQVEFVVGTIEDEVDEETGALKFNVDIDDVVPHGDLSLTQEQMETIAQAEIQAMVDRFFETPDEYFDGKSTLLSRLTGIDVDVLGQDRALDGMIDDEDS